MRERIGLGPRSPRKEQRAHALNAGPPSSGGLEYIRYTKQDCLCFILQCIPCHPSPGRTCGFGRSNSASGAAGQCSDWFYLFGLSLSCAEALSWRRRKQSGGGMGNAAGECGEDGGQSARGAGQQHSQPGTCGRLASRAAAQGIRRCLALHLRDPAVSGGAMSVLAHVACPCYVLHVWKV